MSSSTICSIELLLYCCILLDESVENVNVDFRENAITVEISQHAAAAIVKQIAVVGRRSIVFVVVVT